MKFKFLAFSGLILFSSCTAGLKNEIAEKNKTIDSLKIVISKLIRDKDSLKSNTDSMVLNFNKFQSVACGALRCNLADIVDEMHSVHKRELIYGGYSMTLIDYFENIKINTVGLHKYNCITTSELDSVAKHVDGLMKGLQNFSNQNVSRSNSKSYGAIQLYIELIDVKRKGITEMLCKN